MIAQQLPLQLDWPEDYSANAFVCGAANQVAYDMVMRWPDWPERTLAISGAAGAGKTHLAQVVAEKSGAVITPASKLEGLSWRTAKHFIIEDGPPAHAGETTLFHVINWVRECGGTLLLTGATPPAHWNTALQDCQSRLDSIMHAAIKLPDDALLEELLERHFNSKGMTLATSVARYIIARVERSFSGVKSCVWRIHHLSLVKQAPVTTKLVAQAMDW